MGPAADERWAKASLAIQSETLTVEAISDALSARPTDVSRVGDPVSSRSPAGAKRTVNTWSWDTPLSDTAPLDEHLGAVASFVSEHHRQLQALAPDCEMRVHASYSVTDQAALTIPAATVTELARIPADIWITAWAG